MITGNEMAYPVPLTSIGSGVDYFESGGNTGLTIRQHFAAMAMQGLLSNTSITTGDRFTIPVTALAESATHYADALIAELNKSNG